MRSEEVANDPEDRGDAFEPPWEELAPDALEFNFGALGPPEEAPTMDRDDDERREGEMRRADDSFDDYMNIPILDGDQTEKSPTGSNGQARPAAEKTVGLNGRGVAGPAEKRPTAPPSVPSAPKEDAPKPSPARRMVSRPTVWAGPAPQEGDPEPEPEGAIEGQ
jgi:hypothetical protein